MEASAFLYSVKEDDLFNDNRLFGFLVGDPAFDED
jgi:hypothetical protein